MSRHPSRHPTDLELLILKVLWRSGPATVRQVQDALTDQRDLAYTSVITMLNIMTRKGYLHCKRAGTSFIYQAKVTERATAAGMLRDLVDRVFKGSALNVVVHLLDERRLDRDELKELRELVNRSEEPDGREKRP